MGVKKQQYSLFTYDILLWNAAPIVCAVVSIGVYQYLNETLSTSNLLMSLTLFKLLHEPLDAIPYIFFGIANILVSMRRITVSY